MSKTALMRKITKTLRAMPKAKLALLCYNLTKAKLPRLKVMPKAKLARLCYNITKSKLPRLRTIKRKALPKRKTKRKFSRKQLAAQRLFAKRAKAGTLRKRRR